MCFFANRVFVDQVSVNVVKTADSVLHTGGSPLVDLSLEPTENLEKRHVEFLKHGICVSYLSFPQRQKPLPVQSFRGVLLKSPNSETGWAGNYVCTSWV